MPFTGPSDPSLPDNVKKLPETKKRQWVSVFNSAFTKCQREGGSDCEGAAFRQANSVALSALVTRDFPSVPILTTGTFEAKSGKVTFTREDLDDMVAASAANPNFQAPIKIGHNMSQDLLGEDELPAAGWVEHLRRIGDTLVADLRKIPQKIADLMESGAFRNRSIEAAVDFELGGRQWPHVLIGMALLGAELPAVQTLDDITALYSALSLEAEESAIMSVGNLSPVSVDYMTVMPDAAFAEKSVGGPYRQLLHHNIKGAVDRLFLRKSMEQLPHTGASVALKRRMLSHLSDHAQREGMAISREAQLVTEAVMEDELRKLLGLGETDDVLGIVKGLVELSVNLRKVLKLEEGDDLLSKVTELSAQKPEVKPDPSDPPKDAPPTNGKVPEAVATLQKALTDTQKTVLELQGKASRSEAEALVDTAIESGRLVPAQKEQAIALALGNQETFTKFVESQPEGRVPKGEIGRAGDGSGADLAALEPTAEEIEVAKASGIWSEEHRISLMRQKAAAKQIELPDNFGKKEEKKE